MTLDEVEAVAKGRIWDGTVRDPSVITRTSGAFLMIIRISMLSPARYLLVLGSQYLEHWLSCACLPPTDGAPERTGGPDRHFRECSGRSQKVGGFVYSDHY